MRRTTKMTGSVHVTMPVLEQFEFVSTFGKVDSYAVRSQHFCLG